MAPSPPRAICGTVGCAELFSLWVFSALSEHELIKQEKPTQNRVKKKAEKNPSRKHINLLLSYGNITRLKIVSQLLYHALFFARQITFCLLLQEGDKVNRLTR